MGNLNTNNLLENNDNYEVIRNGENGISFLVDKQSGNQYVLKQFISNSDFDSQKIFNQLRNKKSFNHQHLLKIKNVFKKKQSTFCSNIYKIFAIVQYSFLTLEQQIRNKRHKNHYFQENQLWSIAYSCSSALKYLYQKGMIHQTLTSDKIYLDKEGLIKICDPQMLGFQKNTVQIFTRKRSGIYLSTQQIQIMNNNKGFIYCSKESDVFTLGMILLQCCNLTDLDEIYQSNFTKINKIKLNDYIKKVGNRYSSKLKQTLEKMLKLDPNQRIKLNQIQKYILNTNTKTTQIKQAKPIQYQKQSARMSYQTRDTQNNSFSRTFRNSDINRLSQNGRLSNNKYPEGGKKYLSHIVKKQIPQLKVQTFRPLIYNKNFQIINKNHETLNNKFLNVPRIQVLKQKKQKYGYSLDYVISEANKQNQSYKNNKIIDQSKQKIAKYKQQSGSKGQDTNFYQKMKKLAQISKCEEINEFTNILDTNSQNNLLQTFKQIFTNALINYNSNQEQRQNIVTPNKINNLQYITHISSSNGINTNNPTEFTPQLIRQLLPNDTIVQVTQTQVSTHYSPENKKQLKFQTEQYQYGSKFQGYKLKGMKHGYGKFYYQDGGYYQGEWKQDKMNGYGKLYYQNGDLAYEGYWKNNLFHGRGKVFNENIQQLIQPFNYYDMKYLDNYSIYFDGIFENDLKEGQGQIKLSNGEVFEGKFVNNNIKGAGIFYRANGQVIQGIWQDNKLIKIK